MKMHSWLIAILAVLVPAQLAISQDREQPKVGERVSATGVEPFMQRKLAHAKHVLEGVVLSDFDRIAKHGQMLSLLSLDSNWHVIQSKGYAQQSAEFRRAADAIVRAAKQRNADAAALAYMDLTMKCVTCHRGIPGWRAAK